MSVAIPLDTVAKAVHWDVLHFSVRTLGLDQLDGLESVGNVTRPVIAAFHLESLSRSPKLLKFYQTHAN